MLEWIRKLLAPDSILSLGLPLDHGRLNKPARMEDDEWRQADLGEGRQVRFAVASVGAKKITGATEYYGALGTPKRFGVRTGILD